MPRLTDEQLSKNVDQLLQVVENMPLKEEGKTYLRGKIIIDVYDVWQFDDENNDYTLEEFLADNENPKYKNVKATYGIDNSTQWNRYVRNFFNSAKKFRNKVLVKYLEDLEKLSPAEKTLKISQQLEKFSKAALFHKYGIEEIKDPVWNKQVQDILGEQMKFAKEQAKYITKTNLPITEEDLVHELYIVEQLENKIAFEGVRYQKECDEFWQKKTFDPAYMGNYIRNDLVKFMNNFIIEKLRPLNQFEKNKYLMFSAKQFETHTPPKRHKAFQIKFNDAYWFPNPMPFKENETWMLRYANLYWKHYSRNFEMLKEAFMNIYESFYKNLEKQQPIYVDRDYNQFLKDLYYTYPLYRSPVNFYFQWKENLKYLKNEILENLIVLPAESKIHYLQRMSIKFNELLEDAITSKKQYEKLFVEFKTSEEEVLHQRHLENDLVQILNSDPPSFRDTLEPDFHPQTINLQTDFYNYNYGQIIREALEFVNNQINVLGPNTKSLENNKTENNLLTEDFDSLLPTDRQSYILDMLEDLGITVNGKSVLTERKKSAVRGIAEALLEANFLPAFSLEKSYRMLADKIGVEIKSSLDFSTTSQTFKRKTEQYLKNNPPE